MAQSTITFLDTAIDSMSISETVNEIETRILAGKFIQHSVVNVAKLANMNTDQELKQSVQECDIINIDGMGVVWGARFCGHYIPERVTGIDLFQRLIEMSVLNKFPIFLLGATEDIVKKTAEVIQESHPDLILGGYHHGYFWGDEDKVVDQINTSCAKLLFVAISSPKKEIFINKWKEKLEVNFVMGVGGSFDIVAGKVKRAPIFVQKAGLEWFYRLCQEPRRMWKRYLVTNLKFAYMILKEKLTTRSAPGSTANLKIKGD